MLPCLLSGLGTRKVLFLVLGCTTVGAWLRVGFNWNVALAYTGTVLFALLSSFYYMLPATVSAAWFRPSVVSMCYYSFLESQDNGSAIRLLSVGQHSWCLAALSLGPRVA